MLNYKCLGDIFILKLYQALKLLMQTPKFDSIFKLFGKCPKVSKLSMLTSSSHTPLIASLQMSKKHKELPNTGTGRCGEHLNSIPSFAFHAASNYGRLCDKNS